MFVLYEEDGAFKTGHIMSESDSTLQVESDSGKRSKVKRANCIFTFASPAPDILIPKAELLATEIDLAFLWECAPSEEFDIDTMGTEYFGHTPDTLERTTLLFRLHSAPIYFHRRGRGRYRAAPPDILSAALAAQEKKQRAAAQTEEWAQAIASGQLPEEVAQAAMTLVTKPDKNSQIWKALEAACAQRQTTPERLLLDSGAWPHALALHKGRFLATYFPRGTGFAPCEVPGIARELPLAEVEAYSVDDISTTEIDDALSVTRMPDGNLRVGIHIAAPGLSVTKDSALTSSRARECPLFTCRETKSPCSPKR